MRFIDVSVPLDSALPSYPGNTPYALEADKRVARGESSNVSTVRMSAHAGTHVDGPRHFFDGRPGVEGFELDLLIGPARVVDLTSATAISAESLSELAPIDDLRILFKTSNSQLWGSPQFHPSYVGVTESGARHLIERGVRVVGVDYLSVEVFKTPGAPAHHVLLGGGAAIIEGLNLRDVEPGVYDMYCLPLRMIGSDGAPARVVLRAS